MTGGCTRESKQSLRFLPNSHSSIQLVDCRTEVTTVITGDVENVLRVKGADNDKITLGGERLDLDVT